MLKLKIKSNIKDYQVIFIEDLKKLIHDLVVKYPTHFLIDVNIWNKYKKELSEIKVAESVKYFDALEKNKNLKEVNRYIEFLLENKIQKRHKMVVIGGGLVQDIGSFTSHILKRGIDWIFIPSTLLSMSDSCIGAKSGINVGKYKNQVGSFHPPIEIYIYSGFLKTLHKNDFINGIGEITKHALIKGGDSYSNIKKELGKIHFNYKVAKKIIFNSLLIKKEIVEEDELEGGLRKLLNYGHTFGHALEGYTKNKIPHGLGVLVGMDIANYISVKRKLLSEVEFNEIHKLLRKFIQVKKIPIKDVDLYMKYLSTDKKAIGNSVDAILCKGIGKIKIIRTDLDHRLKNNIEDYLKYFNYDKSK